MRAVTAGEAPAGEDGNDPTPEVQVSAGSRWLWCVSTPVLAAGMLLASGCKNDPVNETHTGRLEEGDQKLEQDQSFYDSYSFRAKEGWKIVLELESGDFDAYVHLMDADNNQLAHNDDVAEGNTNSRLEFIAPSSGSYTALANSLRGGATGAYTLKITAGPP